MKNIFILTILHHLWTSDICLTQRNDQSEKMKLKIALKIFREATFNQKVEFNGKCKNIKLANESFIKEYANCTENILSCKINENYLNRIQYKERDFIIKNVTAIVKTGGRYLSLIRLIDSIWNYYPGLKIILIDDFEENMTSVFRKYITSNSSNILYKAMNTSAGISRGRNLALSLVKTNYFLLLDDDFEFTGRTRLEVLANILESTDASVAGGEHSVSSTIYCNYFGLLLSDKENNNVNIVLKQTTLVHLNGRIHETIRFYKNCHRVDVTKNFFIAKTDDIKQINGWTDELNVIEHLDFFVRLSYFKKKTVWCSDIIVNHLQDVDDIRKQRNAVEDFYRQKFHEMHNFTNYNLINNA